MPCHSAMTKDFVTASPEEAVEKVLANMKKKKARAVAIIDENQQPQGVFSVQVLLKNTLPVSVPVTGSVPMDVSVQAAPGMAKRLKKVGPIPVSDLMDRKMNFVHPETPTWEGVSLLLQHGEPLMVLDSETGKLLGMMDMDSALAELERLRDSDA